ncbi:transcriptional regulator family: Fungal Specific TF [Paecilomyces variotii]|nr:transcriptional regulator family: Fungal Specific TF [Paecilomyces variotii]KAJ9333268.1 transcriptional regulator family: Fungal Specific TF [Paecilomyces variotii]
MSWQGHESPKVKLRSACDRCSANKVKCTQEKPECERCRLLSLPCNYSRSMRIGKPPKSRQRGLSNIDPKTLMGGTVTKKLRPCPSAPESACRGSCEDGDGGPWTETMTFEEMLSRPSPPPFAGPSHNSNRPTNMASTNQDQYYHDKGKHGETMDEMLQTLVPDSVQFIEFPNTAREDQKQHPELRSEEEYSDYRSKSLFEEGLTRIAPDCAGGIMDVLYGEEALVQMPNLPSSTHDGSSNTHLTSSHNCTRAVMENLAKLYQVCAPAGVENGSHPTTDQVLKANSDAMKDAAALLACPCAKDFCFPIILGITACRVLAWYQVVIDMYDPEIPMATMPTTREDIKHCPIAFGAYQLDEEVSQAMTSQFVLRNLRAMTRFVKTYVENFCSDINKNRPGSCSLIYRSLGTFMQTRLGNTIEQLEDRLAAFDGEYTKNIG